MRFLLTSLASALAIACSSGGGGGGAISCADGGACPTGFFCDTNGFCAQPAGTGGTGATGATGAVGGIGATGATGAVGGSGGTTSNACDSACQKAGLITCANPVSPTCVSECLQARDGVPACAIQFDAFIACQVANGTPACDADGDPTLEVGSQCDGANSTYVACVSGGTGGASGGGGTGGGGTGGGGTGGGGTGGGGSGGTPACGIAVDGTPACDGCGDQFCCSQLQKCGAGTTCNSLIGCLSQNCPDGSCLNTTCSAFASGMTDLQNVGTCVCNSCSSQCATFCAP